MRPSSEASWEILLKTKNLTVILLHNPGLFRGPGRMTAMRKKRELNHVRDGDHPLRTARLVDGSGGLS